jgi:hypothetical protein
VRSSSKSVWTEAANDYAPRPRCTVSTMTINAEWGLVPVSRRLELMQSRKLHATRHTETVTEGAIVDQDNTTTPVGSFLSIISREMFECGN